MPGRFHSFAEFWPYYVGEHARAGTRALHFAGLASVLPLLVVSFTVWPWAIALWPVCGYACAWLAHLLVEKNRPATFTHPWWSLCGDFRMFWLMLRGRMHVEVETCRSRQRGRV